MKNGQAYVNVQTAQNPPGELGNKMKSQRSSAKTLADMLKELNNNNLIKREVFNEIPPIVDFTLIKGCEKFREAILHILYWLLFWILKKKSRIEEEN